MRANTFKPIYVDAITLHEEKTENKSRALRAKLQAATRTLQGYAHRTNRALQSHLDKALEANYEASRRRDLILDETSEL